MSLTKRFFYFFIGVSLGSVMVFFIFGERDFQCNFWPNERILSELREREMYLSPSVRKFMHTQAKDSLFLEDILRSGDIDFGRSQTRLDSCNRYYIEYERYEAVVEKCRRKAKFRELRLSSP